MMSSSPSSSSHDRACVSVCVCVCVCVSLSLSLSLSCLTRVLQLASSILGNLLLRVAIFVLCGHRGSTTLTHRDTSAASMGLNAQSLLCFVHTHTNTGRNENKNKKNTHGIAERKTNRAPSCIYKWCWWKHDASEIKTARSLLQRGKKRGGVTTKDIGARFNE